LKEVQPGQYRNAAILDFFLILFIIGIFNAVVSQVLLLLRVWLVLSEFQLYFTIAIELMFIVSEPITLLFIAIHRLKGLKIFQSNFLSKNWI